MCYEEQIKSLTRLRLGYEYDVGHTNTFPCAVGQKDNNIRWNVDDCCCNERREAAVTYFCGGFP